MFVCTVTVCTLSRRLLIVLFNTFAQVSSGYLCVCCDGFTGLTCSEQQSTVTSEDSECGRQCSTFDTGSCSDVLCSPSSRARIKDCLSLLVHPSVSPDEKVIETSNLVEIFPVTCVTDVTAFRSKIKVSGSFIVVSRLTAARLKRHQREVAVNKHLLEHRRLD